MKTYCNPVFVEEYPRGTGGESDREFDRDYRSLADPEVIFWKDKWYMYPTYRLAYESADMVHWRPVRVSPDDAGPAPTVLCYRDQFYLSGGDGPLYAGDSPTGPFRPLGYFRRPGGEKMVIRDTMLFADDDGSVYLYWGLGSAGIFGVRLDPENLTQMLSDPVRLIAFDPAHAWERFGEYNQSYGKTYLEGAYMLKEKGRYYLVYSAPGTCYGSYCLAAYVSDQGPLQGFVCQKRNPILATRQGLIRGPGHGSFARAKDGSLWCYYTIALCYDHKYERRIGMDRAGIDENGELYVDGATSIPRLAPDAEGPQPQWLPLTVSNPTRANGCAPGRESFYAVDESLLTWWQPAPETAVPEITVELKARYRLHSYRLLWRDVGLKYQGGVLPGPIGYVLYGREHDTWRVIADHGRNALDVNCDYRTCDSCVADAVRLQITSAPSGITPGLINFTVFGTFASDV